MATTKRRSGDTPVIGKQRGKAAEQRPPDDDFELAEGSGEAAAEGDDVPNPKVLVDGELLYRVEGDILKDRDEFDLSRTYEEHCRPSTKPPSSWTRPASARPR